MQIHYHRGQTAAKIRNLATLNSAAHIKQRRCAAYMAGENNSRALYIASSESCKPNKFVWHWNKVERKYIKSNNQVNSTVATRTRCAGIVLTKIKAISLCLFCLFEEMLSVQFFWNIQRKANYPRAI